MVTELKRMRQRYDTAANFTSGNPTLLAGEIGIESDTKNMKIGDGSTAWTSLAYASVGVTARDTSLGQLQIGGVEMGDTGWRNIASLQENGWAMSVFRMKRIGNTVTLYMQGGVTADDAKTSVIVYTIPAGFRSSSATNLINFPSQSGLNPTVRSISGHRVELAGSLSSSIYISLSWVTDDAWPTSLPGVAV